MDITEENEPYCAAREADFVVDKRGAHDAVGDTGAGAAPRSSSATPADAATRSDNLPRVATAPSASAVPQSSRAEAAVPGPTPAGSAAPTPPAVASGNAPSPSDCAAKSPCRGPSTRSRKSARRRQPAPAAQLPDHSYDSLCGECGYEEHQESIQEAEEAAEEEHEARRDLETATDDHRRAEAQRRVDAALARQKSAVDKGCLMVCCDGRCLRSFHVACMHDPSVVDDDSDEEWLCQDCTTRNHR